MVFFILPVGYSKIHTFTPLSYKYLYLFAKVSITSEESTVMDKPMSVHILYICILRYKGQKIYFSYVYIIHVPIIRYFDMVRLNIFLLFQPAIKDNCNCTDVPPVNNENDLPAGMEIFNVDTGILHVMRTCKSQSLHG